MSDEARPGTPSLQEFQARLHTLAQLLRKSGTLSPESKQAIAELLDELGGALQTGQASATEASLLAETTAQLEKALRQQHDRGRLASIRDQLEKSVLAAEAQAPLVSGLARRVLDALTNIGI